MGEQKEVVTQPKHSYTRRVIPDSKDVNVMDWGDKTGIVGRPYCKGGRVWSVKYIYKGQEYLSFPEVQKVYEKGN